MWGSSLPTGMSKDLSLEANEERFQRVCGCKIKIPNDFFFVNLAINLKLASKRAGGRAVCACSYFPMI